MTPRGATKLHQSGDAGPGTAPRKGPYSMNRSTPWPLHRRGIQLIGPLALLACAACSPGDVVEIQMVRQSRDLPTDLPVNASGAIRFGSAGPGMASPGMSAPREPLVNPFRWIVPDGWQELEPSNLRLINFRPAGNPDMECYLTVLGGGGTLTENVNRWRTQMALPPVTTEEAEALPRMSLLGQPATIVDLIGTFSGMGSTGRPDWGMLGAILPSDRAMLFVKMTGPAKLVREERPNFESFCATLRAELPESDPHAGHDHAPGEGHEDEVAVTSDDVGEPSFDYDLPQGWREGPPKMLRQINLEAGEASQCYVIVLAGEAGGLELNINRWLGEVENDPLDSAGIAALEQVDVLGTTAPLVEADGDYQGMGGPAGESMTLLGVPVIRSSESLFIKMVGPRDEIAAEREHFLAFVRSLVELP